MLSFISISKIITFVLKFTYIMSCDLSYYTYHRVCTYMSNLSGDTCGEGSLSPSGAPETTTGFSCCSVFGFLCCVLCTFFFRLLSFSSFGIFRLSYTCSRFKYELIKSQPCSQCICFIRVLVRIKL